jgi:outer membrane biosynthesis protein TonB
MLNLVACDQNVQVVNFFHLVDESDLGAWQSGLFYVGYQPKASAGAVAAWIARTGGGCTGATRSWTPAGASTGGSGTAKPGATPKATAKPKPTAKPKAKPVAKPVAKPKAKAVAPPKAKPVATPKAKPAPAGKPKKK